MEQERFIFWVGNRGGDRQGVEAGIEGKFIIPRLSRSTAGPDPFFPFGKLYHSPLLEEEIRLGTVDNVTNASGFTLQGTLCISFIILVYTINVRYMCLSLCIMYFHPCNHPPTHPTIIS